MQDYFKDLGVFNPKQKEKFIEITVPVVTKMNYGILTLKVLPLEKGYIICDDGQTFDEFTYDTKYYYDLFMEKTNRHYNIQLDGDRIYKQYPYDYNIEVAVNEFVRFFVYLDDFIIDNNIT